MKKLMVGAVFVLLWQGAAMAAARNILPSPLIVLSALARDFSAIASHGGWSLFRLAAAMAVSVGIGLPLGIWMGYYKKAGDLFSPLTGALASLPKIALLPVIMLFFGIGEIPKTLILFFVMVFQIMIAAAGAVKNISHETLLPLKAAKAKDSFIIRKAVLPSALPGIFSALKIGLATGISVLFFAETFGTVKGLGFYIMDMWTRLNYPAMYAGIVCMGLLGFWGSRGLDAAEKLLCPWTRTFPDEK